VKGVVGKVHLAKFILDAGEIGIVNTRDFKGKTPLIRACYIKVRTHRAVSCFALSASIHGVMGRSHIRCALLRCALLCVAAREIVIQRVTLLFR